MNNLKIQAMDQDKMHGNHHNPGKDRLGHPKLPVQQGNKHFWGDWHLIGWISVGKSPALNFYLTPASFPEGVADRDANASRL
jgi:hypothetical protein